MAKLHGVLYKLGGRRYPDLSATGMPPRKEFGKVFYFIFLLFPAAFEKLDLTSPSPAWVALPDAPFAVSTQEKSIVSE